MIPTAKRQTTCLLLNSLVAGILVMMSGNSQTASAQISPPPSTQNLLKNGGFEQGNENPDHWNRLQEVPGVEYLWTTGVSSEGKACAVLKKYENRFWPIAGWYQDIPHDGSPIPLRLLSRVKAEEVSKAVIDIEFRSAEKAVGHKWVAFIGMENPGDTPVTHDWKEYTGYVDVPPGTSTLRVSLQIYGPGIVGFDSVSLLRSDGVSSGDTSLSVPSQETTTGSLPTDAAIGISIPLVNPGFEEGVETPSGWQQGTAVPGVDYFWSKEVAHSGKASLGLRKTVQRYFPIAQWSQSIPRTGDARNIRISAWTKCDQVTKAILDVQFLGPEGAAGHEWVVYIGAKNSGDPPDTHDWKLYEGTVAIPDGVASFTMGLQIYGPGTVWFDDIKAEYME